MYLPHICFLRFPAKIVIIKNTWNPILIWITVWSSGSVSGTGTVYTGVSAPMLYVGKDGRRLSKVKEGFRWFSDFEEGLQKFSKVDEGWMRMRRVQHALHTSEDRRRLMHWPIQSPVLRTQTFHDVEEAASQSVTSAADRAGVYTTLYRRQG